jgi:hypothetical protein
MDTNQGKDMCAAVLARSREACAQRGLDTNTMDNEENAKDVAEALIDCWSGWADNEELSRGVSETEVRCRHVTFGEM